MDGGTKSNIEKYLTLIKTFDPELYDIKIALEETKVNPYMVPRIIRAIANIYYGTGFGKVTIQISNGEVSVISGLEKEPVNLPAVLLAKPN